MDGTRESYTPALLDVAIIGMAGKFPGARNAEEFWQNLKEGMETLSFFSEREAVVLDYAGGRKDRAHFVGAEGILDDIDMFDAPFFGYSPREAETIDPQQRLFLQCAWEALEDAGYNPEGYSGSVGVYAGSGPSGYLLFHLFPNPELIETLGGSQVLIGNDKDYLATRISYKLNLQGPSLTVQSACSTSLVAVHLACQSLLRGECDMALAGGVSIKIPQGTGYFYQEEGISSPDGHCRAFDKDAKGTVTGSGLGIVVLKSLENALRDHDHIYAVIKGSAINNDGSHKAGYTAPSINGQASLITEVLEVAEINAETITYMECHGTGTSLGDPIEIAALAKAFQTFTSTNQFCAIGSLKTNMGHLGTAAGVAGLMKTTLALTHKQIPPSLHFKQPNPEIDFSQSPFYVNTALKAWDTGQLPRRAGVSSFGIGGTNAHALLEEAPLVQRVEKNLKRHYLLIWSAQTGTSLEKMGHLAQTFFSQNPDAHLVDIAYTYSVGRKSFKHRKALLCSSIEDALSALQAPESGRMISASCNMNKIPPVCFMFPGQGSHYVHMAAQLYRQEEVFRATVDSCCDLVQKKFGLNVRAALWPIEEQKEEGMDPLGQATFAQIAIFIVEYALARLWMNWGIHPQCMIGHSIGEYVAACLAEVFSLEDGLELMVRRGQLVHKLQAGVMVSVPLAVHELRPMLGNGLEIAAINGQSLCVVSGPERLIRELEEQLTHMELVCKRLHTSHAFHSHMMEPMLGEYAACLERIKLSTPKIPYISNVTGTWITQEQATDSGYWVKHLRETVQFFRGMQELLQDPELLFVEVGPGQMLGLLTQQHSPQRVCLSSLGSVHDRRGDDVVLLESLARLWLAGVEVDWLSVYQYEQPYRVSLPVYPFDPHRYWVNVPENKKREVVTGNTLQRKADLSDWFYVPVWKQSYLASKAVQSQLLGRSCLLFAGQDRITDILLQRLSAEAEKIIVVREGKSFYKTDVYNYTINPHNAQDYRSLLQELAALPLPQVVINTWGISERPQNDPPREPFEAQMPLGFLSLLYLIQALGMQTNETKMFVYMLTTGICSITDEPALEPLQSIIPGLCKVISQEYSHITCRCVNVVTAPDGSAQEGNIIGQLINELCMTDRDDVVSCDGRQRWKLSFEAIKLPERMTVETRIRKGGVYLITGGLGGIGYTFAEYLASEFQAKLILVGRSFLPEREAWQTWLETHEAHDDSSCAIKKILRLEKLGAEVLALQADVASYEHMIFVMQESRARFGVVHGVIHAAGVSDGRIIQLQTLQDIQHIFASKIMGTLVLDALLKKDRPDFFLFCSSRSSLLGGPGQAAYVAANQFLDAFATHKRHVDGVQAISVNWGEWEEVGMAARERRSEQVQDDRREHAGIRPSEGVEAFLRILAYDVAAQVIVSPQNLDNLLKNSKTFDIEEYIRKHDSLPDTNQIIVSDDQKHETLNLRSEDVKRVMVSLWQELLGVQEIHDDDNFFKLGGHSLLALQLLSRVRTIFQIELSLRTLFIASTMASFSASVEQALQTTPTEVSVSIPRASREKDIVLSYAQQRLWILNQLYPGSAVYTLLSALRLEGTLFSYALAHSVSALVKRHEILRTTFANRGGQPIQVIRETPEPGLVLVDLQGLSAQLREAEVERLSTAEARQPFDLQEGPLLRATLIRVSSQEHVALFVLHHIVSDGWSTGIMIRELVTSYEALVQGKSTPRQALPIQYADYAVWQREWLSGAVLDKQLAYWRQQLEGMPGQMGLPTDRARGVVQTFAGARHQVILPARLAQTLKALSLQEGATLFMILLAAFDVLLARHSGQEDIVVGTAVANRGREEVEDLIGCFVNTLVLRTKLSGNPSFREVLKRVREVALGAYAHQDVPFERVVEELQPQREVSVPVLFQVWFELNNVPLPSLDLPGLKIHSVPIHYITSKFDLMVDITEREEDIFLFVTYNVDLFFSPTIEKWLDQMESILYIIADDMDIRMGDIFDRIDFKGREWDKKMRESILKKKQKLLRRGEA